MMNETVKFDCICGQALKASESRRGQQFECPSCGNPVVVPLIDTSAPSPDRVLPATNAYLRSKQERQQQPQQTSQWVGLVAAAMFFIFFFACCLLPMISSPSSADRAPTVKRPGTGENGRLRVDNGGDVPFATSQVAYDRLVQFAVANDDLGTRQLFLAGLAGTTPTGTQCRVIRPGIFNYEVRILDGLHKGALAFVASDFVFSE